VENPADRIRPTGPTVVRTAMPVPSPDTGPGTPPPSRRNALAWARSPRAHAWISSAGFALTILGTALFGFLAELSVVGGLQHSRGQQLAYANLREELANATAPVGPADVDGRPLRLGAPVALLRMGAPVLTEVVLNGTTSGVLMQGVGHRRDTVLPGQPGVSVLMGRRTTFGGPFRELGAKKPGQLLLVTTGQAKDQRFRVIDVRRAGDPLPPALQQGGARLTLITTSGDASTPDGTVFVDADLIDPPQPGSAPAYTVTTLPREELPLRGEWRALIPVTAWGTLLVAAAIATTWLRLRWGTWQTWTVAVPTLGFLGIAVAGAAARLLPNLL
jgi:hypothetical protein